MPNLSYDGLKDRAAWAAAGIKLPDYDPAAVAARTRADPIWVHFGAGNIFRAYIAALQDSLLGGGHSDRGVVVAETYDPDILEKVYSPYDNLCLAVTLSPDCDPAPDCDQPADAGIARVVGSVSAAYAADEAGGYNALIAAFENPGLQLVSFTITEKAYELRGADGDYLPAVRRDIENGPARPSGAMSVAAALLLARHRAGGMPVALVSMDNCSRNGERLRASVVGTAELWAERGYCGQDFLDWLRDPSCVAFPWTMIDKITPWPSDAVAGRLLRAGVADVARVRTDKGTVVAPFVNTEAAQYLVIEDSFPNGRPPLERAGVIFADRETVNRAERMKVTTCLNPLHTALAVFGFLLGHDSIAAEMKDPALAALVRRIGYDEGLPVVTDPGVINPRAFLDEVIERRLPNPQIPDAPPRIAADTSLKIPIRFGETIKAYMEKDVERGGKERDGKGGLIGIPLALAGWLRYLLAVDDALTPFEPSPDPALARMKGLLAHISVDFVDPDSVGLTGLNAAPDGVGLTDMNADPAAPDSVGLTGLAADLRERLRPILSDASLFGVDLCAAGLDGKIAGFFADMLAGPGAVRRTLERNL